MASINTLITHPSLAGHYPGMPIVPGVVLFNHLLSKLQQSYGMFQLVSIKKIKFLQLVLPGQDIEIESELIEHNSVQFICQHNNHIVAKGQLTFLPLGNHIVA